MSNSEVVTDLHRLKSLEVDLARGLGEARNLGLNVAATLLAAALEEVGERVHREYGSVYYLADSARADN